MSTTPQELDTMRQAAEAGIVRAAEVAEYQLKDNTRVRSQDPLKLNELRKDLAAEAAAASGGYFQPVQFGDPG